MKTTVAKYFSVFQSIARDELPEDELREVTERVLRLPWVQKLLVFSHQAITVIDFHTMKYLYVSPSIEGLLGYKASFFTDVGVSASLMGPAELERTILVSQKIISKLVELNLNREQMLKLRIVKNDWYIRKDGTQLNILQHMFILKLNDEGMPTVQMTLATDITSFNSSRTNFVTITLTGEDHGDKLLYSEGIRFEHGTIASRELDVLRHLSSGQSSAEIATQLGISIETVKSHRKNLLKKTAAKNSIDLVRTAFAQGWL